MNFTLKVWRQRDAKSKGHFETYQVKDISEGTSFLEMMDILNEQLIGEKIDPVAFDAGCHGKQSGRIYTKSTMQSESLWFTQDDNNFSTADNQLGSIVKDSAAAYSFDASTDLTSLIQKNNLITYGGKK